MARVRLFAALRELAGTSSLEVDGATVAEIVDALGTAYGPRFTEIAGAGTVVVDGERASFDRPLEGGEEVALLPPVAGGASGWHRPRRVLVVANPVARTVSRPVLDVIEKSFAADFEVVVDETRSRGHATEMARAAVSDGIDLMVVFSGDGTVNEAVNGLAGGQVALGVLPGGATNVLARAVGMPQDPVEATGVLIAAALEGRARRIGLGSADGRRFAINCGVGIDADAMARVDERKATSRGQFERAALGAVVKLVMGTYAGMDPFLKVSVDGAPAVDAVSMVAGRTNPYSFFRNMRLRLTPEANLEGGLDVTVLRRLNRRSVPRLARQVFSGRIVKRKDVDYVHDASSVEVVGTRPFPVQVDGDSLGTMERLSVQMEPDVLWLVG